MRYADYVVSGMGNDDTLDGMSLIKRFKKEPYPKILVSVNMLDTGFDWPLWIAIHSGQNLPIKDSKWMTSQFSTTLKCSMEKTV